jgi:dihydrodipicolinate synthase/N-acetylneuraminate lyase
VKPLWTGVAAALVTLFDNPEKVGVDATAEHAARLVDAGVRAVLVNGSTGEASALTDAERVALVTAVREACPGVPLIAGASGEWWRPAAERVVAAVSAGADAVLVAPPRVTGDLSHFYANVAAAAGDAPVLAYHYPGKAGGEVPVDALPALPVRGVKDSSGDPDRLLRELAGWTGWTYVGSALLVSYAAALGATGAILAAANAAPEDCVAAWDGDAAAQRSLLPVQLAARDRFPHGLKEAVARRFGTPTATRLG